MSWANLPWELKERPQWCLAAPPGLYSAKGKEPLSIDPDGRIYMAKSNSPSTWLSWDIAEGWARHLNYHLGYMLHEEDPYTCIDLDVKDVSNSPDKPESWTTREHFEAYASYIRAFDTYTEHSASGKGFHIWVKGKIGKGFRHNGVEVGKKDFIGSF